MAAATSDGVDQTSRGLRLVAFHRRVCPGIEAGGVDRRPMALMVIPSGANS